MNLLRILLVLVVALAARPAMAIDELFERDAANPLRGFQPAQDKVYQKECSGCHFVYLPGLLPARSWVWIMERLDKHFGEQLELPAGAREVVARYLQDHAADRSAHTGSQVLMETLPDALTPQRVQSMPRLRTAHRVMREVIARNYNVKMRNLVNCDGCHQQAEAGDFSLRELRVEGLRGPGLIRSRNFTER